MNRKLSLSDKIDAVNWLGAAYHLDIDKDATTPEELVDFLIENFKPAARERLKRYIDEVTTDRYDNQYLLDVWRSTPCEWIVLDGEEVRRLFLAIRARL